MILSKSKKVVLPKTFSAGFVNRVFFPQEYKSENLAAINTGRCYDWAYIGYCLWPEVLLWTTDMHAWIQKGRKFFDSESVTGLKDHKELRCNAWFPGDEVEPTVMDVQSFKDFWNNHGGGRTHHWNSLLQKITKMGLTPIRS